MRYQAKQVVISGRLARDPELRYSPNGKAFTKFSIPVNHSFRKGNDWERVTNWWNITVWEKQAEEVNEKLQKGDSVIVTGEPFMREYETTEGVKRCSLEILFATVIRDGDRKQGQSESSSEQSDGVTDITFPPQVSDADLPF